MNWMLVLVIATLFFYSLRGRRKGFIKTVFTVFSTIIAILLTMWIIPYVSKVVQSNDEIVNYVSKNITSKLINDDIDSKRSDEIKYIEKLPLPSIIKNRLIENNTNDVYDALSTNNFQGYINRMITLLILNFFIFLILCLIIKIALYIIGNILNLVSYLPIINGLNRIAGMLVGFLHGIIIVWIGFIVITVFSSSTIGSNLFRQINESRILSFIYNNNLILNFLTDMGRILF